MPYMQIYLLSVLSTLLGGACLARHMLAEKFEGFRPFAEILKGKIFQLIVSIIALLAGLFTLLTFSEGNPVIVGDLLPSIAALVVGGLILADFLYDSEDDDQKGFLASMNHFNVQYGAIIGITSMVISLLHAIIPTALFL